MSAGAVARGLVAAEELLASRGLVGSKAFDALIEGLLARIGGHTVPAPVADAVACVPSASGQDLFGLAYERFFPSVFKTQRGQYFTPKPVAELLWSRLPLSAEDEVVDPTCGSGGLLVAGVAAGAMSVRGVEVDPQLAQLATYNLALCGAHGEVRAADVFRTEVPPASVLVANPPFSVPIVDESDFERVSAQLGRRARSDHLFLFELHRWVRDGGRAGLVVPHSIVANPTNAPLRRHLAAQFCIEAVCLLPEGVFRPFGGAQGRAALVWLHRAPRRVAVSQFSRVSDPGYDVRSRRYQPTASTEVTQRSSGQGWQELPPGRWMPTAAPQRGVSLSARVKTDEERTYPKRHLSRPAICLDLADVCRVTGEVRAMRKVPPSHIRGVRLVLRPGRVLVSRLRPELGNITVVPSDAAGVVGSPEWLSLQCDTPHALFHLLRTPSWRRSLPVRGGQTRPRATTADILATRVRWPTPTSTRALDVLSSALLAERRRLGALLAELQDAVDAFADDTLGDDELTEVLRLVEERAALPSLE